MFTYLPKREENSFHHPENPKRCYTSFEDPGGGPPPSGREAKARKRGVAERRKNEQEGRTI